MFASSSSGCISTVKFGAFANLSLVFSILQGCHSNDSSSGILQFSSGGFAITIQSSSKFAIAPKILCLCSVFCRTAAKVVLSKGTIPLFHNTQFHNVKLSSIIHIHIHCEMEEV